MGFPIALAVWGGRALYTAYRARQAAQVAATIARAQAPAAATAGALVGGGAIVAEMATGEDAADDADVGSGAIPIAGADACSTCQPPECPDIVAGMRRKNEALNDELRRYDPVSDAQGGHPYAGPGGVTRYTQPGGHYQEIRDLQRGLRNDLERYNRRRCYTNAPASDRITRDAAQQHVNRHIEVPPGQSPIPL